MGSFKLAIANAICNIASCALLGVMVSDNSLFNQGFISELARLTGTSLSQVTTAWSWSISNVTILFVLISAWYSFNGFRRAPKKTKHTSLRTYINCSTSNHWVRRSMT